MSNRAYTEGYEEIVCPDGRRGLWMKIDKHRDPSEIHLCAGRGGDDDEVLFTKGDTITSDTLRSLEDCLRTVIWSVEISSEKKDYDLRDVLVESIMVVLQKHIIFFAGDINDMLSELEDVIMARLPKRE